MNFDHWRHYARGWIFHFFGQSDTAYEAFVTAHQIDPADLRAARHLASIAAERRQWDAAASWFGKVLDHAPDEADAWFNLGFVQEQGGHSTLAIEAFKNAVHHKPAQDRAWYGMGLAHARLGQHEEAAAALKEAVALQPMNGEAYYQLGMALHHARHPDEVTKVVKKLVGFEPKRAKKLVQETERADLMPLIPELPF